MITTVKLINIYISSRSYPLCVRGRACVCVFVCVVRVPEIYSLSNFPVFSIVCCSLVTKSCPALFVTPWTVASQAPLSVEFSRREDWRG